MVRLRVALLATGGFSLLAGLDAALVATGVWAPVTAGHLEGVHGMIMTLGFLGTLIALERAQALRKSWAYLAPALLGSGGIALAINQVTLGRLLLIQGVVALAGVYVALWRRAPLPLVAVQVLATIPAFAAAALWLSVELSGLIPLLVVFLVLTIAAERAELAQLALGPRAIPRLVGVAAWLVMAAFSALLWPELGSRLLGIGLLATAAWLARDDVARRMVRSTTGLRRFNGAALLAGYGWLAVGGLVWLIGGAPGSVAAYDVVIHATFLGFGVSMVMAHAPIIFPAVLERPLPYHRVLWLPLVLLHGSLAVRFLGEALTARATWQVGAVGTVASLLVFVASAAWSGVRA